MELKIGAKMAQLRRQKGLTQEQLAEKLGISAPAVSKWETDTSYPDITLLCPLARALDTSVDALLQFEEKLSPKEAAEKINDVLKAAPQEGYEAAGQKVFDLLHQYPNSIDLKFYSAVIWDSFLMFFPSAGDEARQKWRGYKKALLTEVRSSQTSSYWQTATLQLAGIAIADQDLEQGEKLLKELPEHSTDPAATWALLYLKKNEPEEALKTAQKRMFSLVGQVLSCLCVMLNPQITPDNETALKICEVYKSVDQLFHMNGLYDGLFLEIYLRMNRYEEAADCLARYADAVTGDAVLPTDFLFSPGLARKQNRPATAREIRQILLKSLEGDEIKPLLQYPQCRAAIEKIRASLETYESPCRS